MSWLKWIIAYFFDCSHARTTWPRRNQAGLTYLCCVDCGRELPYSMDLMRIVTHEDLKPRDELRALAPHTTRGSARDTGSPGPLRPSRIAPISTFTLLCVLAVGTWTGTSALWPAQLAAEEISPAALKPPAPALQPGAPHVIIVGFLGGFVQRRDPHHPEVQLIQDLQREYPSAYSALFENSNIEEAYRAIRTKLDGNRPNASEKKSRASIILFGHSWGGSAVVRLARKLDRAGIPVALTVQVDSVAKPFTNDRMIPANVAEAANFYQTHGLIHGRPNITAADPIHTKILGNFRRDYKSQPAPCRRFRWYSRLFTRGHIAIECDPDLWVQVKTLMLAHLSDLPEQQEATISETRVLVLKKAEDPGRLFRLEKEGK